MYLHSYKYVDHMCAVGLYCYLCRCEAIPLECATIVGSIHYAPGIPFIDETPADIMNETQRINQLPNFATCAELINTLICIISFPICDDNNETLLPICLSQCQMITNQLTMCLTDLSLIGSFPIVIELFYAEIICEDPETYYSYPWQYISDNTADCLMIGKLNVCTSAM